MTWIKLDDRAVDHPKVASLTDRAFRWWVRGLSYASTFLTDGVLPPIFWKQTPKKVRAELSSGRLWDWVDPNFQIHDYLSHQSSREAVDRKKAQTAERVKRYREKHSNAVTAPESNAVTNAHVTAPEIRDQRTDTENREQRTTTVPPLRPLVSGESSPKGWGKIHGDHVAGFCDWVCLPDFVFSEFVRKSAGADYVREWAKGVRVKFEGQTVGDNLKFWRVRWSETHPEIAAKPKPEPMNIAKVLEREAQRKAERLAQEAGR
jgi:hypothetical protein